MMIEGEGFVKFEMDLVERWWHHLGDNIEMLSEADVLDVFMLRHAPSTTFTADKIIELIDTRKGNG